MNGPDTWGMTSVSEESASVETEEVSKATLLWDEFLGGREGVVAADEGRASSKGPVFEPN
jgi:hypothetical protein